MCVSRGRSSRPLHVDLLGRIRSVAGFGYSPSGTKEAKLDRKDDRPAAANASTGGDSYEKSLVSEGRRWGDQLQVEAAQEMHAWLDHPRIRARYFEARKLEGHVWERWVADRLGGMIRRGMELGCGSGTKSLDLALAGIIQEVEGIDASADRIAEAERFRLGMKKPGAFRVGDANRLALERGSYDLVFSVHSFHHFLALEQIMAEVHEALAPGGLFVLEEFVGPTQFQWTDVQMELTRSLLSLLPERLRRFRWGATKDTEGRPTVAEVVAASPFESIRSSEILPLFRERFRVVECRPLGGTIQHLLYNGIVHNFVPGDEEADRAIDSVGSVEDTLIDGGWLPSDFMLLVGTRKD